MAILATSAQVHTHLDSAVWWTDRRPKTLRLEGSNDHFDHSDALKDVFEREGLGRNGENIREEHVRQMLGMAKTRDMEEYAKDLERAVKSGELQRCAKCVCATCMSEFIRASYSLRLFRHVIALKVNVPETCQGLKSKHSWKFMTAWHVF